MDQQLQSLELTVFHVTRRSHGRAVSTP
ncbi:hypothetical protein BOSE62_140049 [Bosea sp. 62]|nr:hypothetical protein BOSE21B_20019 [Bosea sp. 21B]VXB63512.1 hypothetical protein BOSE62_140049 [Bosea sp. 62]